MWDIKVGIIFTIIAWLNTRAKNYVKKKAEEIITYPYEPLPDLIHQVFPKLPIYTPDCSILLIGIYTIIQHITYELNNLTLNIYCLMFSLLLRPIFMCVTLFPSCITKPGKKQSLYNSYFISTHDFMFSGHTCVFIFLGKCIGDTFGNIVQFYLPFLISISRNHYTIDILVAMVVYNFLYNFIINNSIEFQ